MGLFSKKTCSTNYEVPAPNPKPDRWVLQNKWVFDGSYVLQVKYLDCTNYEGVKVIVYQGQYSEIKDRDPHFSEQENSPIARFRPTDEGLSLAFECAKSIAK